MKSFVRMLPAVALALVIPAAAAAQSSLDTSAAGAFMGSWELEFESPQGALVMTLALTDAGGKVAASISNDMMGDQEVTDVSVSGDNIVLRYEIDAQGQIAPVALTVTPAGTASMDFADGMFVMDGTATKQM
jgi:hypothetical protein